MELTLEYFKKFAKYVNIKVEQYKTFETTTNKFIEVYNETIFKNDYRKGTINWESSMLISYCRFMFHANFNGYNEYLIKIYPFICKRRYSKNEK